MNNRLYYKFLLVINIIPYYDYKRNYTCKYYKYNNIIYIFYTNTSNNEKKNYLIYSWLIIIIYYNS